MRPYKAGRQPRGRGTKEEIGRDTYVLSYILTSSLRLATKYEYLLEYYFN